MKKMPVPCTVYRSSKRDELFLYVKHKQNLSELPKPLIDSLGDLELVMNLLLTDGKKLSRVDAQEVLNSLEEQGYFLQMPPSPDEQVDALIARELLKNTK